MFQRLRARSETLPDLERIEALVRARFALAPGDLVLVSEEAGRQPGMPPRETVIRFWSGDARYRIRVFKPVREVSEADLPVGWLLPAFVDDGEPDCC